MGRIRREKFGEGRERREEIDDVNWAGPKVTRREICRDGLAIKDVSGRVASEFTLGAGSISF